MKNSLFMSVATAFFMASCSANSNDASPAATPLPKPTPSLPRLIFKNAEGKSGFSKPSEGACTQLTLGLQNGLDGSEIIAIADVKAIITASVSNCASPAIGSVFFYSDSGCMNGTDSVVVSASKSSANFYFKLNGKACWRLNATANEFQATALFEVVSSSQ